MKSKKKLLIFFLLLFLPPVVITISFFNPWEKIEFMLEESNTSFIELTVAREVPSNFFTLTLDLFEASKFLPWYKIFINNQIDVPLGCEMTGGALINLRKNYPAKYGFSNMNKWLYEYKPGEAKLGVGFKIPQGETGYFLAKSDLDNINFGPVTVVTICDRIVDYEDLNFQLEKIRVYAKPFIWAWFIKLFVVLISWIIIISSIFSIIDFIQKKFKPKF
ncbi:hypothetical protein KAJ89_03970 [Candidatus Parcubacteria bacterium]|nr:hypothetical protein [Candidatus Parcubacteria bacterium]